MWGRQYRVFAAIAAFAALMAACASMEEDWERTKKHDLPTGYSGADNLGIKLLYGFFIKNHPDSPHVPEARQRIDAIVNRWYADVKSFSGSANEHREKYRVFIRHNGDHPRGSDAMRDLEDLWWADTRGATSKSGLRAYLREYPQGRHAFDGRQAYERLKAVALADPTWASGIAPNECIWKCFGRCESGVPGMLEQTLEFAKVEQQSREAVVFTYEVKPLSLSCAGRRDRDKSIHETWCSKGETRVHHDLSDPKNPMTTTLRRTLDPSQEGQGGLGWQRDCD